MTNTDWADSEAEALTHHVMDLLVDFNDKAKLEMRSAVLHAINNSLVAAYARGKADAEASHTASIRAAEAIGWRGAAMHARGRAAVSANRGNNADASLFDGLADSFVAHALTLDPPKDKGHD